MPLGELGGSYLVWHNDPKHHGTPLVSAVLWRTISRPVPGEPRGAQSRIPHQSCVGRMHVIGLASVGDVGAASL